MESSRRIRPVVLLLGVAAFAAVLALSYGPTFSLSFKHRLVTVAESRGGRIAVRDVDLDGDDEIIVFSDSETASSIIIRDFSAAEDAWKDVKHLNFERPGTFQEAAVEDITGDGYPDFFVAWRAADESFWIDAYRSPFGEYPETRLLRLGPFLSGCRAKKDGRIGLVSVAACFDLDRDGDREILVFSYPFNRACQPRQLIAFDASTGRKLWYYDMAPAFAEVSYLEDQSGSGRDLIISTYAPANTLQVDGTTDTTSYVFCLSAAGEQTWRVGFNGASSRTFTTVADLNRDGKLELIVSRLRSQGDESSPNLLLLDPATGRELDQKTVRPGLGKCLLCNLGPRGRPLVLCPAQDNTLYCLDDRFNERWRTGGGGTNILAVIGIGNLDGRGDPEILVANYSGISVLDVDGRVLADVAASGPVEGSALAVVGGRRVAVFSAGGLVRVAQLRRPDVSPVGLTTIAGSAAALLIGLMVWIRTRARRVMGVSDRTTELLDAMIAFGHGGGSLRVIDRLRFHLQNWKRWAGSSSPSAATFAELCETYTRAVLPDLLSVASLARRSGVARDTWRSLEENARRADADVRSLVTNSKSEDRVARATSHLVEVDRCLQEVRGHLRRMFSTPLQPLLEQVLARRRADFQTMGVTVSVTGLVERYPSVFVSDVALDKILDGLVSNALAAMARSSERRLAVEVASEGDHYTIDVGDTGCGIAEENWERVFDRDYTTKEGGGFGLYYARHETARFGGKIYVLKSAVGAGTTMRVILRSA